jgi:AcrR family transcriptional regulator
VSQPYVIRLFGSKQRLFVTAVDYAARQIEAAFRDSGATDLDGLGDAYDTLLDRYEVLGMLLHGLAASGEPEIGARVRECFGRLYTLVRELTGAEPGEAADFIGVGMFLTIMGAMRVIGPAAVTPVPWMTEIHEAFSMRYEKKT